MLISSPKELNTEITRLIKKRRIMLNFTQEDLANKSGIPISTIRRFEQTGKLSAESLIKILFTLDLSEKFLQIFEQEINQYDSIEELLESNAENTRQRASKRK